MSAGMILLVVVVLMAFLAQPRWPYSRAWGHAPVGALSVLALVVAVMVVMQQLA